jgi:hypothetical protein
MGGRSASPLLGANILSEQIKKHYTNISLIFFYAGI